MKFEIQTVKNIESVSARDIHSELESKKDFSSWIKMRIEKYGFVENQDFIKLTQKVELSSTGQNAIEYYVSTDMGKMLGMVENTEKGREVRQYFIDAEKNNHQIPQTLPDALRAYAIEVEKNETLIESIKIKNDLIIASNEANIKEGEISIREFVKTNDAINIGGNKFFEWMRNNNIIFKDDRKPKQPYVDNGWLTWKFSKEEINGQKRRELKVTSRGQLSLAKKFMKFRYENLELLQNALK